MREDYSNLGEVFDRMNDLQPGRPEYNILKGKVYDTLRWHVEKDIPDDELSNVTRFLHGGHVSKAEDKVSEYLEPSETSVVD